MSMQQQSTTAARRTTRRLKPEVVQRLVQRRRTEELERLYETPVDQLAPEEIARMRAAFLRG